jgi:hypothetical protein
MRLGSRRLDGVGSQQLLHENAAGALVNGVARLCRIGIEPGDGSQQYRIIVRRADAFLGLVMTVLGTAIHAVKRAERTLLASRHRSA